MRKWKIIYPYTFWLDPHIIEVIDPELNNLSFSYFTTIFTLKNPNPACVRISTKTILFWPSVSPLSFLIPIPIALHSPVTKKNNQPPNSLAINDDDPQPLIVVTARHRWLQHNPLLVSHLVFHPFMYLYAVSHSFIQPLISPFYYLFLDDFSPLQLCVALCCFFFFQ